MVLETRIFTKVEADAMARKLRGEVSDPTGAFARAREKLLEIQAWHTPAMRKRLHSLLAHQRKIVIDIPAKPNDEQSFNEFRQEIGY